MKKEIVKSKYIPSEEEYKTVRAMYDPSSQLKDEQISLFLHVAKERKLDPKLKQICVIPKFNKHTNRTEAVIITQIDGFRLIAERTGKYAPGKPSEFTFNESGKIASATSFVKKQTVDGTWHEVSATAYMCEYDAGNFIWNKMPVTMLEKCAEAKALRRAFPDALSGLYAAEEMDQAINQQNEDTRSVVIDIEAQGVSGEEVTYLDKIIGDNEEYRGCVMNYLQKFRGVNSLDGISREDYEKILPVAERKQRERMEQLEVEEVS